MAPQCVVDCVSFPFNERRSFSSLSARLFWVCCLGRAQKLLFVASPIPKLVCIYLRTTFEGVSELRERRIKLARAFSIRIGEEERAADSTVSAFEAPDLKRREHGC